MCNTFRQELNSSSTPNLFYILFNELCKNFIHFWLCWVFDVCRLPLVQVVGGGAALHCDACTSHCSGFSSCEAEDLGIETSVVMAWGLQSMCSVTVYLPHGIVESSQTRIKHMSSALTGRQILIHCNNREFLCSLKIIKITLFSLYFSKLFVHSKSSLQSFRWFLMIAFNKIGYMCVCRCAAMHLF